MQERTCECCGWTFETAPKGGKGRSYCDFCLPMAHRHRHYRLGRGLHPLRTDLAFRDCEQCGDVFVCSASDGRRKRCGSSECARAVGRKRYKPSRYEGTCVECGVEFIGTRPNRRHCSRTCYEKDRRRSPERKALAKKLMAQWNANRPSTPPTPRACKWCLGTFLATGNRSYCSNDCRHLAEQLRSLAVRRAVRCDWCAGKFVANRSSTTACSKQCSDRLYNSRRTGRSTELVYWTCAGCGCKKVDALRWHNQRRDGLCRECSCRERKRADKARRRGAKVVGETFSLREIAERDGWTCHICNEVVHDVPYGYRDTDPTLDHLIPVSQGGEHTRENVKLAHMICNSRRNTGGAVQLMLIG